MKILFAILAAHVLATSASAAVVVATVDGSVKMARGFAAPQDVTAGMSLNDGDRLTGSKDASVGLECPNGATQTLTATLTGTLDAVVNGKSADTTCAIELTSGTAIATASDSAGGGASIRGGPLTMASRHTQFGLSVFARNQRAPNAFVVEGEASIKFVEDAQVAATLTKGQTYSLQTRAVESVADGTYDQIAMVYARLDSARIGIAATPEVRRRLQASWASALRSPDDSTAQQTLRTTRATLQLPDSALTRYQMGRVDTIARRQIPGTDVVAPAPPDFNRERAENRL